MVSSGDGVDWVLRTLFGGVYCEDCRLGVLALLGGLYLFMGGILDPTVPLSLPGPLGCPFLTSL